jgi:hypothetical protein
MSLVPGSSLDEGLDAIPDQDSNHRRTEKEVVELNDAARAAPTHADERTRRYTNHPT